jgi:WD40 repeat protein
LEQVHGHHLSLVEMKNGDLVTASVSYNDLKLWRIKKGRGELIKIINCPTRYAISRLTILTDGNVACGLGDGTIQIWNVERNEMVQRLCHHTNEIKVRCN